MANISRRQFLRVSAAAGLGALLTTLAPGKNAIAQTPTPKTTEPELPSTPSAWPLGVVPRFQTLIFLGGQESSMFNPLSPSYNHQSGNAALYEPCAYYNPLSGATILWLAENYQYNANATELTITFRNGIKWSDGSAFTTDDAIWTITTLRDNPNLHGSGTIYSKVVSVVALNNRTIKITLNQTDWRFFLNVFTYRYDLGDVAFVPKSIFSTLPANQLATFEFYDLANQHRSVRSRRFGGRLLYQF